MQVPPTDSNPFRMPPMPANRSMKVKWPLTSSEASANTDWDGTYNAAFDFKMSRASVCPKILPIEIEVIVTNGEAEGFIFNNGRAFKDFLSIDKFCQILKEIIDKKLTGTFNISIGQKVYLNDLIKWLNKYNTNKYKVVKNLNLKNESFYLNNEKIMSKIKIKNSLIELKKFCYNYSKKKFS